MQQCLSNTMHNALRASRSLGMALCIPVLILAATSLVCAGEPAGKGFPLRAASVTPYSSTTSVSNTPYAQSAAQPQAGKPVAVAPGPTPAVSALPSFNAESTTTAFEGTPLAFAGDRSRSQQRQGDRKSFSMPSIWPALLAVMAVCSLFVAGLYVMKKYLPGHRQLFNHPAMELLGRTHLDQRRFVTLLRVGRRLVVVGVSQDEMRTLAEITDESEITEIMEVARPKTEVGLTVFQKLFQRNVIEAEAEEAKMVAREKVAELDAQMSALRDRVREIKHDIPADPAHARAQMPAHTEPEPKKRLRRKLDAVG